MDAPGSLEQPAMVIGVAADDRHRRGIRRNFQMTGQGFADVAGEIIAQAQLDMFASHVGEAMARHLEVAPDSAAMTIIRRYTDQHGRLFETTRSIHPEGRFVYSLDLQRDWRTRD